MIRRFWLAALIVLMLIAVGCSAPEATQPPASATPQEMEATEEVTETEPATEQEVYVVGMMTIVSHPSLDAIQQGVKDRLAEAGFVEGENLELLEGNAEGDMATLSTIAQQYVDEGVDLIVATTTPAIQAAYNATKDAEGPPIIFNGVSNPYTAGIANAPDDHPSWVLGNQLLDPVEDTMELIRELLPEVDVIGLVYNPAEANAVYLVDVAKEVADEMGVTLELASVSNSSEIQTAAESLVARDIDAYLAVNDNTVTSGFEALVKTANENDIPLFGTSASMPPLGAAASYGINPYQEGLDSGDMAVAFLKGELDLATGVIQIQDAVLLTLNPGGAQEQGLELPQELIDQADKVVEMEPATEQEVYVVGMMTIVSHPSLDAIQQGVKDRLAEAGFVEGENLELLEGNAEGDMATLSTIAQQYVDEGVDLIVATTTPAIQAAYNATKDAEGPPIIFNGVSNPYTAGIANAPDDHPSWVLGNQLLDPVEDTMELIRELLPEVDVIGLVYNPAEANAVYLVDVAKEVADEMGVTLELASVSNSSEIQTAAKSLVARDIDAYLAVNDNTVTSGFEALVKTANENDIPLFGTSASMPPLGAAASYGINPYQEGLDSGDMAVAFLKGELDLATGVIQIQDAVLLTVNPGGAQEQGLELPQELIDRADKVVE